MTYTLEAPRFSWMVLPALGLAAAYAWHLWRSKVPRMLAWLRAAGTITAAMALLNPALVGWGSASRKPRLLILVDSSDSMGARDGGKSRLEEAAAWLQKNRREIESKADCVLVAVSDRARRLLDWQDLKSLRYSNAALAPEPAIGQALSDWPAGGPPDRGWFFSDGNSDPPGDLAPALRSLGIAVDAVGVGRVEKGPSADFIAIKAADFAFVHESFEVRAKVEASNMAGQKLILKLSNRETNEAVDRKEIAIGSDFATETATLTVANAMVGIQKYRLEAQTQGGTVLSERDFELPILREKYRMMYLTGRPSWDYVFLRRYLKSDPNRELVSFVILRNPENPAAATDAEMSLIPFPAYQVFVSDIAQFDLLILENFSFARFNLPAAYLDSIKSFVANGGSLLVVGGDEAFTAGGWKGGVLDEMLPANLSSENPDFADGSFLPEVTARSHPLIQLFESPEDSLAAWKSAPPLKGYAHFASLKPDATVLAAVPGQKMEDGHPLPFLAIRPYGRGRVMLLNSNSTWRWKLGTADNPKLDSFYDRFWSRTLSYLVGNLDVPRVKFSPLPERLAMTEPAVFTLKVFDQDFRPAKPEDAEVSVQWTDSKGRTREVAAIPAEPGAYTVSLTGISAGANRLRASVRLKGSPWGEAGMAFPWKMGQPSLPMAWRRLKEGAQQTGGSFARLGEAKAASLLSPLRQVPSQEVEARRIYPTGWPVWFWLTALLWTFEWGLRRWKGYV